MNLFAVPRSPNRSACPGLVQQTDQIAASRDLSLIVGRQRTSIDREGLHSVARRFYQLNSIFRSDYNPFLGQKEPVGAIHIDNKSFPNFDRFVPHCNVCAHSMKRLVALSSSKAFPLLISANFQHTPDRLTP